MAKFQCVEVSNIMQGMGEWGGGDRLLQGSPFVRMHGCMAQG